MRAWCRRLLFPLTIPSVLCAQTDKELVNGALTEVRAGHLDSAETLLRPVLDSSAHPQRDIRAAAFVVHGLIGFLRGDDSTAAAAFHNALELRVDLRGEWLARVDSSLWRLWRHERCRIISGPPDAGGVVLEDSSAITEKLRILSGPPPLYPANLRVAGVQGRVVLLAVIDTAGRAEWKSIRILESPHPDLSSSAQHYLERVHMRPARMGDRPIRVCVEVPVDYRIRGR
jgi:TonB family protein